MRPGRLRRCSNLVISTQGGFSLLELMVVLAILSVVLAVVMSGVTELQKKSSSETAKVDLTQQSRQFMDQIVKDLHHSGYPSVKMFEDAVATANPALYGDGLMSIGSGALQFEGDVDGTGTVSEVFVQLTPAGGPCPCTLQRGAVSKQDWLAGLGPSYYTQVDNVMSTNVFTAILNDGTSVSSAMHESWWLCRRNTHGKHRGGWSHSERPHRYARHSRSIVFDGDDVI